MGQVYREVEFREVLEVLTRRGYGVNHNRAYSLQLTKKDPTRIRRDKRPEVMLLVGVTAKDLSNVLLRHDSPESAADELEALALGHKVGTEPPQQGAVQNGMDADTMARLVDNRTENKAVAIRTEVASQLAEMKSLADEMREAISALKNIAPAAPQKRRGRPKGSKNKPKEPEGEAMVPDFGPPPAKTKWFEKE